MLAKMKGRHWLGEKFDTLSLSTSGRTETGTENENEHPLLRRHATSFPEHDDFTKTAEGFIWNLVCDRGRIDWRV